MAPPFQVPARWTRAEETRRPGRPYREQYHWAAGASCGSVRWTMPPPQGWSDRLLRRVRAGMVVYDRHRERVGTVTAVDPPIGGPAVGYTRPRTTLGPWAGHGPPAPVAAGREGVA